MCLYSCVYASLLRLLVCKITPIVCDSLRSISGNTKYLFLRDLLRLKHTRIVQPQFVEMVISIVLDIETFL